MWKTAPLGDIIKLEYGKPLPKEDRSESGKFQAFGANGAKCNTDKTYYDKPSIIVGRKGSAGELTLVREPFWPLDVTYFVTYDKTKYDLDFLYHCLKMLNLPTMAKGVKPGINRNDVYALEVSLPPLEEQKRIVAILDKTFAGIDQAIAGTEQNIQNAQELFESSFIRTFILPQEDAGTKPLSELCEFIVDCEHKTAPTQDKGIASIRTPNIGFGELLLEGVNRVSEDTYEKWTRRGKPQAGDLILAREAPAGNIGLVPEGERVCLGQRTVLLRPKKELISSKYLCFFILHPFMQKRLLSHSTGATVQHINMKDIRAFPIGILPNLTKQEEQAQKVEILYSYFQKLTFSYQSKLTALKELKQSLLQKAFTGELTSDLSEAA